MCTDRGLDKEDVVHRHSGISPECALTEEWIKKMWCIDTVGYHTATEKKQQCWVQQHGWTQR